jgi:hypothetical protein
VVHVVCIVIYGRLAISLSSIPLLRPHPPKRQKTRAPAARPSPLHPPIVQQPSLSKVSMVEFLRRPESQMWRRCMPGGRPVWWRLDRRTRDIMFASEIDHEEIRTASRPPRRGRGCISSLNTKKSRSETIKRSLYFFLEKRVGVGSTNETKKLLIGLFSYGKGKIVSSVTQI